MPCTYAHHDYVGVFSPVCEQFGKLGYCDKGHECHKIHWRGPLPEVVETVKRKGQESISECSTLEAAKVDSKENSKVRGPASVAQSDGKAVRRLLTDGTWRKKAEVVVRGETTGELALQEDFVPF